MSITYSGIVEIRNRPKITKIYAKVNDAQILGIVFEHADLTQTMFTGPLNAANNVRVNPLKAPTGVQIVNTPAGFDRLEWGASSNPGKSSWIMSDLNFYKNNVLIGTIINTSKTKSASRRNLVLAPGNVANGVRVAVYIFSGYLPHNNILEIYGMKDLEAPIPGGWGNWSEWGACSTQCGTGIMQRTRTCTNPSPAFGGAQCSGPTIDTTPCSADCVVNGGWSNWSDWDACIKNAEGVGQQQRTRTCTNPAPKLGGTVCDGMPTQVQKCVLPQPAAGVSRPAVVLSQPAAVEHPPLTIGATGGSQSEQPPVLDQPSVVVSTATSTDNSWMFILLLILVFVVGGFGVYKYRARNAGPNMSMPRPAY
jgi:hypothetical protein